MCHCFIVNAGLQEYQVIGDVRGEGLMLGIELVESKASKIPATLLANQIKEAAKCREHVLIAIEGPHSNVIKIKPPIIFSMKDVNQYIAALRKVISARFSLSTSSALQRASRCCVQSYSYLLLQLTLRSPCLTL